MTHLFTDPDCIGRLDSTIFLQLPLYKAKTPLEPIYVNQRLFSLIFLQKRPDVMLHQLMKGLITLNDLDDLQTEDNEHSCWTHHKTFIQDLFSVTIDKTISTGEQCGWAYVDRQADDSYGTSLDGNLGSGRAYYSGKWFNIKGEKTPLAVSSSAYHSSGIFSMDDGIWSTLIGNALFDEFGGKLSPVLAILRIDNTRCKIVRIDLQGSLDRITHLLYAPSPISETTFLTSVQSFAQLEAKKFITRILHGAWSSGNISLHGHLIDYDTICSVKGRQSQYSFTPNYIDNYFGFEQIGQLLVLKNMLHHSDFQLGSLSMKQVEHVFELEYKKQVAQGFVLLMGFDQDHKVLSEQYQDLLQPLVELFCQLSRYTYFHSKNSLYTNYPSPLFFHLFDFSFFFRMYPLFRLHKKGCVEQGLAMLMHSDRFRDNLMHDINDPEYTDLGATVKEVLDPYLLSPHQPCPRELQEKATLFIIQYDALYQQMVENTRDNAYQIAVNAYVLNEDRLYLFPVFSVESLVINQLSSMSSFVTNRMISRLILANQRYLLKNKQGFRVSQIRLFREGLSYLLLGAAGLCSLSDSSSFKTMEPKDVTIFRVVIHIDKDSLSFTIQPNAQWRIEYQGRLIKAEGIETASSLQIMSEELSLVKLIQHATRDDVFLIPQCTFYMDDKKLMLSDLFFPHHQGGYYV